MTIIEVGMRSSWPVNLNNVSDSGKKLNVDSDAMYYVVDDDAYDICTHSTSIELEHIEHNMNSHPPQKETLAAPPPTTSSFYVVCQYHFLTNSEMKNENNDTHLAIQFNRHIYSSGHMKKIRNDRMWLLPHT